MTRTSNSICLARFCELVYIEHSDKVRISKTKFYRGLRIHNQPWVFSVPRALAALLVTMLFATVPVALALPGPTPISSINCDNNNADAGVARARDLEIAEKVTDLLIAPCTTTIEPSA